MFQQLRVKNHFHARYMVWCAILHVIKKGKIMSATTTVETIETATVVAETATVVAAAAETKPVAKGKGSKGKGATKPAKPAQKAVKQEAPFINVIANALVARRDACIAHGLVSQADQLKTPISIMTDAVMKTAQSVLSQTDFNKLAETISFCDEKGKGKEQVKSIVKIARVIQAFALKSGTHLDNNTRVGIVGLLVNDNHSTVREMVFTQSKAARRDADLFAVRESFKTQGANYSPGTGNSQASQVRQVLNGFGFFDGFIKGQKGNDPKLTEYGQKCLHDLVMVKK